MQRLYQLVFFTLFLSAGVASAIGATCKVEDPDIATEYSGGCRNGLAHGKGTAIGRDKYVGDFRDGELSGKGIYTWANGNRYEGDYRDGKPNGKGVYTRPSGTRYEGGWRDARRNGYGVLTVARSEYHELEGRSSKGDWKGDQYIEQGIFEGGALILQCPSEKACAELQASAGKIRKDKTFASAVTSANMSNSEGKPQAPDPTKNSGAAKGFRFEEPSGSRYTERLDPKVGVVVVDNERRLEWTKCFAGMESNGVGEPCNGKPQLLNHTRAVEFAEKLGWSLPPLAEYRLYEKNSYGDQIRLLLRDNGNRVWSSTGVSDTPNRKWAFIRVERSGGIYGSTSYTEETYHIDEQLPVMLIRRVRR